MLRQPAALGAAACLAVVSIGCGADDDASSRESADAVPSRTAAPEPSRSSTPRSARDSPAEAQGRGRLPFRFSHPRGFLRGRTVKPIVASLLLDRRNVILISRFGSGAPTGPQLQEAIQSKLTGAGTNVRASLKRQPGGLDLVTINLSEFRTTNRVAGRPVAARRLYFSAGNTIWEVSCQYTRDGRERVLAGCAQVASSLRPT